MKSQPSEDQIIQFARKLVRIHSGDPEKELAANILLVSILDFLIGRYISSTTQGLKRSTLYSDAAAWFSNNSEDYIFYFIPLCNVLDINPTLLRELLLTPIGEKSATLMAG